jgi:hypothetical protein
MEVGQMKRDATSPRIKRLTWGQLELEDGRTFKDAKLYPGGAREWDWRETGTGHQPGVQPADVRELIERGATVVVLSQGMNGRLRVSAETLALLEDSSVRVHVLPTERAVARYNELVDTEPVGALIHSTC